jgi:hypothetical protein
MSSQTIKKLPTIQIELDSDLAPIIKQTKKLYSIDDTKQIIKLLILQGFQKHSPKDTKQNFITYLDKLKSKSQIYQSNIPNSDYQSIYEEGLEYAILTDEITKAWADKSVKQYKNFKNLKKQNLRDNMTNLELVLNMLAEASTTEISKVQKPKGLNANKKVAKEGGNVAKQARITLENQTGKSIISSKNATELQKPKNLLEKNNKA